MKNTFSSSKRIKTKPQTPVEDYLTNVPQSPEPIVLNNSVMTHSQILMLRDKIIQKATDAITTKGATKKR